MKTYEERKKETCNTALSREDYEAELRAEIDRLNSNAPGTIGGRLRGVLQFAEEYCGHSKYSAKAGELTLMESFVSLRDADAAFQCVATVIQGAYVSGQLSRPPYAKLADLIITEYSSKRASAYEQGKRAMETQEKLRAILYLVESAPHVNGENSNWCASNRCNKCGDYLDSHVNGRCDGQREIFSPLACDCWKSSTVLGVSPQPESPPPCETVVRFRREWRPISEFGRQENVWSTFDGAEVDRARALASWPRMRFQSRIVSDWADETQASSYEQEKRADTAEAKLRALGDLWNKSSGSGSQKWTQEMPTVLFDALDQLCADVADASPADSDAPTGCKGDTIPRSNINPRVIMEITQPKVENLSTIGMLISQEDVLPVLADASPQPESEAKHESAADQIDILAELRKALAQRASADATPQANKEAI